MLALFACPRRFLRPPGSEAQFPCRAVERPNRVLAWQLCPLVTSWLAVGFSDIHLSFARGRTVPTPV